MSERKGLLARLLNLPAVPDAASAGSRVGEAGPWVPPEPIPPLRVPMMCSANGGWITLFAEEHDTVLRVVGYEIPQAEQAVGGLFRDGLFRSRPQATQPRLLSANTE